LEFNLPLHIAPHTPPIGYQDKVLLTGSCFTEHISNRMAAAKMAVMANPHGILFNPLSVADSIKAYIDGRVYGAEDLFLLQEIWNCWDFHSRFSHTDKHQALEMMNRSTSQAASFIREAGWLIVTLGSAFQYFIAEGAPANYPGISVANCHRAPGKWFDKRLLEINDIVQVWDKLIANLQEENPGLKIIFTISPVRHIRDGVIDNNRSKARLIEAVHRLVQQWSHCSYFPAYELVIDILRDHRFYDTDMVHPNYAATQYVWEQFVHTYLDSENRKLLSRIQEIATAHNHKIRFPYTEANARFKATFRDKIRELKEEYPYLDLEEETRYFS
jgi:hypothetical protein